VLLVLRSNHVPRSLEMQFQEIKPLAPPFAVVSHSEVLRTFYFYSGTNVSVAANSKYRLRSRFNILL